MAPRSSVFRCCFFSDADTVDTEPYELARCEPSIVSELSLPASFAVAPLARSSEEINASSERNKTSWCTAQLIAPGSNGQLHSFADDQSFSPPLCSTKIGEGVRSKSLSLTAVEQLVTCPLLPEEKPKREFKFRSSRPLRRVTTIVSPQSFLESSESEFDNTQMVIPSFHSLPKISPTSHTVEATNSPPKDVGGDLTTDKVPPTTNFLASAKKIAFIDIVNFSEKTKQRDSEEIDIDEELLRNATDVENRMGVEMNGVNPPANDLNFANVPNFCSKSGNRHRLLDGTTEVLNDDEVSEVCVLAPPNTPVDVDHREGIGVQ